MSENATATMSPDRNFRYVLRRDLGIQDPRVMLFVMLNPSKADEHEDDPTIRRCVTFGEREGMGAIEVVNLFAWRETDPAELWKRSARCQDIIGPENIFHIREAVMRADLVVAAWGASVHSSADRHMIRVAESLRDWTSERKMTLQCLGTTQGGYPRHPLFVKKDRALEAF